LYNLKFIHQSINVVEVVHPFPHLVVVVVALLFPY